MNYDKIIDTTIRKMAMYEQMQGKAEYLPVGPRNKDRRAMLDSHISKGRLRDSPLLAKGFEAVKSLEAQIRRTKLQGLPSSELRRWERAQISRMIGTVESAKAQRMKAVMQQLDKLQKDFQEQRADRSVNSNLKRLTTIEETKLRHAFTDEAEATGLLAAMSRDGIYEEIESMVLGATGKRAHAKMLELHKSMPPHAANPDSVSALQELEILSALKVGEIPYKLKDKQNILQNVVQRVNVCDLISQTTPRVEDLTPIPETATN